MPKNRKGWEQVCPDCKAKGIEDTLSDSMVKQIFDRPIRKTTDGMDYADLLLVMAYVCMTTTKITQTPETIEKTRVDIRTYLVEQGLLEATPDSHYKLN